MNDKYNPYPLEVEFIPDGALDKVGKTGCFIEKSKKPNDNYKQVNYEQPLFKGVISISASELILNCQHGVESIIDETDKYTLKHYASENIYGKGVIEDNKTLSFLGSKKKSSIIEISIKRTKDLNDRYDTIDESLKRPRNEDFFSLFGVKESYDFEFPNDESFHVELYVNNNIFDDIKNQMNKGKLNGLSIYLDTNHLPGLYLEFMPFISPLRDIDYKILNDKNDVTNSCDLPKDFDDTNNILGKKFSITTHSNKKNFDLNKDDANNNDIVKKDSVSENELLLQEIIQIIDKSFSKVLYIFVVLGILLLIK